jgi:flagellar motor switch protein FliM
MESVDNIAAGQEVLSQSEVENLLAQVAELESKTVIHQQDGSKSHQHKEAIQPYDFRNPVFLSAPELRKLRLHHEEFIRSLAARLSIHLRVEFVLQMSQLSTITYAKFIESLPNPGHLVLFKAEPLRGICLLGIKQRLGLTVVDRVMGGPGHSVQTDRDLSEIEIALLDQIIQIIVGEWCSHWSGFEELRPLLLGHESNARFVNTAPFDSVMLALTLEAQIGDCFEQIHIGFPYLTLEPLIKRLSHKIDPHIHESEPTSRGNVAWNQALDDVQVPVTAEFPGMSMSARRLADLRVGDLLELEEDLPSRVRLRLASLPKFNGRLGTRNGKWAVEINNVLKPVAKLTS